VAVVYIFPYTFQSRSAAPLVLFGQPFIQSDVFQLWDCMSGSATRIREECSPTGIHRFNCDNTTAVMSMSH